MYALTARCRPRGRSYFDQKSGYGLWTPRWGGNDGPDDGAGPVSATRTA